MGYTRCGVDQDLVGDRVDKPRRRSAVCFGRDLELEPRIDVFLASRVPFIESDSEPVEHEASAGIDPDLLDDFLELRNLRKPA